MAQQETIIRFENVSFEYNHDKPILNEVDFSLRKGAKFTIMGQNGAGKSTLFKLITGELYPDMGEIHINFKLRIATALQVMPAEDKELNVQAYFKKYYHDKTAYNIDMKIAEVLEVVNLKAPLERIVGSFSGGQQARLLLASALIQDPDILLLDEPTNNLDTAGIEHLTQFLIDYKNTCLVISHDADFLNAFTEGVLYLDVHTQKMEQYVGNYFDVVKQIAERIEKENLQNARLAKGIKENLAKAEVFAHKGGKLRLVAKRMREKAEAFEEEKVDVRKEDKTIRPFQIPVQDNIGGEILGIRTVSVMKDHYPFDVDVHISLRKNQHLILSGPNGIGKTTLLETLASGTTEGIKIAEGVRVGYYRQDFSTLNFEDTVYESLSSVLESTTGKALEEHLRSVAAGFLIYTPMMDLKVGSLSEGQKGLLAFARLVLQKPGLLILDEPTNHINFRHLPVIARALDQYEGAMILVSHVPEFVKQIRIDKVLDLKKYI